MLVSIVIRTLNEATYLGDLLAMVARQRVENLDVEVVLVDSGSTDDTVKIAHSHGCRVTTISKSEFSFGRSLNRGCAFAKGDILVFISGHCIPVGQDWLQNLCQPLVDGEVAYSYGRQVGDDDSYFSERRIFAKYFPEESVIPQEGFFCNNANSALLREEWEAVQFDESLTGLEDMALAKALVLAGRQIGYVAEAPVFHHHSEDWAAVRRRFEREAIALRQIMPEVQLSLWDVVRYITSSIWFDLRSASRHNSLQGNWADIFRYRIAQYVGSYIGNRTTKRPSRESKERFFYPAVKESEEQNEWLKSHRRPRPDEGKQPEGKG